MHEANGERPTYVREYADRIIEAIKKPISRAKARALELYYVHGVTQQTDIARTLGVKPPTARTYLMHGKASLKYALDKLGYRLEDLPPGTIGMVIDHFKYAASGEEE